MARVRKRLIAYGCSALRLPSLSESRPNIRILRIPAPEFYLTIQLIFKSVHKLVIRSAFSLNFAQFYRTETPFFGRDHTFLVRL
jgi:hypothetical protein